jgi:hypothetical protein
VTTRSKRWIMRVLPDDEAPRDTPKALVAPNHA